MPDWKTSNPKSLPESPVSLPQTSPPNWTPGGPVSTIAPATAPDQINLQPGLLTGEADIAKVQK